MKRSRLALGLCAALIAVAACTPPGPAVTPTRTPDPRLATAHTQIDARLVAAHTRFGLKLFLELARNDRDVNLFASPASVAMALAMTYNGAAGETRDAMARTLELEGLDRDQLNRDYELLRLTLENPHPDIRLSIANALFARQGVAFKPDFLDRDRRYYGAELSTLDFNDPASLDAINGWVERQTEGRIKNILDRIDPMAVLYLANAIYFKAPWTDEFQPDLTADGPFTRADGQVVQVPMMHGTFWGVGLYRGEGFRALRLPYGGNGPRQEGVTPDPLQPPYQEGRVAMYIFLPDEGESLDTFYAQLNADNWERWMAGFESHGVQVTMPRFTYTYEAELKDALTALGMGIAFDEQRADFSDMLDLPQGVNAYIGRVLHKAFVAVDEKGTEAAAATLVEILVTSAPPEPEATFIIDRPFAFVIQDTVTGSVLFTGSVVAP